MKKTGRRDEAKRHLYDAEQSLKSEQMLTETECSQLKNDIIEFMSDEAEQVEPMELDELLADFKDHVDKSKTSLEEMLSIISAGRIPSADKRSCLNDVIDNLSQKYEHVCALAREELQADELPDDNSSIDDYISALKNSKSASLRARLTEIKEILQRFISVQALVEKYANEITPYQNSAKELLEKINNNEIKDAELINNEVKGPELFLCAVECEDMGSEEAEKIIEAIEDIGYSSRVIFGLSQKKYYVDEAILSAVTSNVLPAINEEHTTSNEEDVIIDEVPFEEDDTDIVMPEDDAAEDKSPENQETNQNPLENGRGEDEEKKEYSEFTNRIIEKELFLDDKKDFGVLSCDMSSSENKKLSASVFTNDLRKGNEKVNKGIIRVADSAPVISAELLDIKSNMPANVAEMGLEFLKNKGYLRKYSLLPGGSFYCTTNRLEKALSYKEASKFVDVRQHSAGDYEEPIEDMASSASARKCVLNLYTRAARSIKVRNVKKISANSVIFTNEFIYRVFDSENPDNCKLFTGVFWTDEKECDDYNNGLKKILEEKKSISAFIIASMTKDFAIRITDEVLAENLEKLNGVKIYIYSFKENAFYDYPTGESVEETVIWPEFKGPDGITEEEKEPSSDIIDKTTETEEKESEVHVDTATDIYDAGASHVGKEDEQKEKSEKKEITVSDVSTNDHNLMETICKLINSGKAYCVPPLVKVKTANSAQADKEYEQIAFALNDPMRHCVYSADSVFDITAFKNSILSDYLNVAIALRTFFSNQVRYDYNIKALHAAISETQVVKTYSSLGNVMYKLMDFKDHQKKGMDAYADYRAKNKAQLEGELKAVQRDAKIYYESTILGKKVERCAQRRFLETKKLIFNENGELGVFIKAVVDNDKEYLSLTQDFIQTNFFSEGSVISEDTIDPDMLWDYINIYWDKAGEKMMMKLRANIMSRLKSNITSSTTKAVQILVRWCDIISKMQDETEDAAALAYKKIRKSLLDDIDEALTAIEVDIDSDVVEAEDRAGLKVIYLVLDEINRCVNGTFDEKERRYFYIPFLFTNDVLLDANYCPDLEDYSTDINELKVDYRILQHANSKAMSPEDSLNDILRDHGDDYGTAELIVDYLSDTNTKLDLTSYIAEIRDGEEYAKDNANLRRDQFVGDLELAQSFGQIDNSNSTEDKKEKILQIVNEWYDAAMENSNFGFFRHVTECYLAQIKKEAKSREKDLMEQLTQFRESSFKDISAEVKDKKIRKILAAINQQNYTVAEDLLARVEQVDEDYEEIVEENFLEDFLDNYNDYYKIVSKVSSQSNANFATLVSKSITHNKEGRGGKRLADNWLPGGSKLGKERLTGLLSGLGFKVNDSSVVAQDDTGRFETFAVKTISEKGGKRDNYTHPIAAFGSGAAQEGFKVVCLNGRYGASELIDVMKQIGNAKNTMILLDYAMDKTERRTLARKCKIDLGDKLFVVIDRTVMVYLVKNYDEIKVNRMLMAIITPFGYYQPYVWESSNVMPPEIFMGRKHELERIESSTGVNIVYGGRQLGKSALLKKAKADIDFDENGDRAVLVDIKGLNYQDAAKKIGHALYDEGVLMEDITTTDWDDLSRTIKKRLQSDKVAIPYLLLLMDEADVFIESCKEINYRPFDLLKDIQSIGVGRFKFVIAGLRNVVRFQKDAALSNNSVLTHLEHMTVKPFKSNEARELMEIPLHYLGLEFSKENEYLVNLILATANYFPGLIQMYCAKLLSAMRNKDYADYDETDTPIYEVSEEHIKKVLADPEFREQVKEKYLITLKLDEDNYYYLIALIMAYLYNTNGYNNGYSADDIKETCVELGIAKIAKLDSDKLVAFMEELKELNVLRSTDDTHYLFTRFTFFQMMGTKSDVEDEIGEYMED